MASFKSDFLAKYAVDVMNTILLNASVEDINKFQLMRMLGGVLAEKPISAEDRYVIMDAALKFVTSLRDAKDYMASLEAWAEFTAKHFPLKQINFIMNDILSHLTPNRAFEDHYPELKNVVERIVANVNDFEGLMTMVSTISNDDKFKIATNKKSLVAAIDLPYIPSNIFQDNFLPVIDLFQKESVKLDVCKSIMGVYRAKVEDSTSDPVLINNLMFLCRTLNDSVNSLTSDDERRQICALVSHFIQQVHYGRDFEAQLAFYGEARAAFLNLDAVYSTLVTCVVRLMCRVRGHLRTRSGGHTKKTLAFARACSAFCFITVPSIGAVASQMDLYYLAGGAALINGCLGQADACLMAAINLIGELPASGIDAYLLGYVPRLLTVLVVTPDSPDLGMLYLPNLLMDQLVQVATTFEGRSTLVTLYLHLLDFYVTVTGETYENRLADVISNDRLYGSDPKFVREVEGTCNQIVEAILEQLQALGEAGQTKWQAAFALELFQRIVFKSDLTEEKQFTLAVNLWGLALRNRAALADPQLPQRLLGNLRERIRQYEVSAGEGGRVPAFVDSLRRLAVRVERKL